MGKHKDHQHEGGVAVEEASQEQASVEQPKTKVGDKPETAVDAKEKKARKSPIKTSNGFRILDGVDASKFAGQRGHVVRSLQKLQGQDPDKHWSLEEIVANTDNLVSKTPVEASVGYHLKGLVADGQVVTQPAPVAAKAEEPAA